MNKTIEKIEAWPNEKVTTLCRRCEILNTDDLHQLAREYRALIAVLEAAKRYSGVVGAEDDMILVWQLDVAIAEARRVIEK